MSAGGLAWLLACLDNAVRALDDVGSDIDARVVEAHRAQLARGKEWPGDAITSPDDLETFWERQRWRGQQDRQTRARRIAHGDQPA